MINIGIEGTVEEICTWNSTAKSLLIIELLERSAIDFVEVSKLYIEKLDKERKLKTASIANLGLMLSAYCMNDTSKMGETSRKYIYDSGAYGHNDGSVFGKLLDHEFGNNEMDTGARRRIQREKREITL